MTSHGAFAPWNRVALPGMMTLERIGPARLDLIAFMQTPTGVPRATRRGSSLSGAGRS